MFYLMIHFNKYATKEYNVFDSFKSNFKFNFKQKEVIQIKIKEILNI